MANKEVTKYPINKEIFMKLLKEKGLSIRKLGKDKDFPYGDKTIERSLKTGTMSLELARALSFKLEVPILSFSQKEDTDEFKKWKKMNDAYRDVFVKRENILPSLESVDLLIAALEHLREEILSQ